MNCPPDQFIEAIQKKDAVSTDTASKIIESTTLFLTKLPILQGINEHDRKDITLLTSYSLCSFKG